MFGSLANYEAKFNFRISKNVCLVIPRLLICFLRLATDEEKKSAQIGWQLWKFMIHFEAFEWLDGWLAGTPHGNVIHLFAQHLSRCRCCSSSQGCAGGFVNTLIHPVRSRSTPLHRNYILWLWFYVPPVFRKCLANVANCPADWKAVRGFMNFIS